MNKKTLKLFALSGLFALSTDVLALSGGLVQPDDELHRNLMFLSDQGVISLSLTTWPMSAIVIENALNLAQPTNEQEALALQRAKQRLYSIQNGSSIGANIAGTDNRNFGYFGSKDRGRLNVSASYAKSNDKYAFQGRLNGLTSPVSNDLDRVSAGGSYIGANIYGQWITFGALNHYWGAGHTGSLIYGDTVQPVIGFTIQRNSQEAFTTPWLSWIGPWNYQLTFGQLSDYESVPNAKLINMRVTAQPFSFLELGAHRAIQWGGSGRPNTLHSFKDALLATNENPERGEEEPGNQIAGLDFRLKFAPLIGWPVNFYAQMVGEDEAGGFPAKKAYLTGFDGSFVLDQGVVNWFLEYADTRTEFGRGRDNVIYRHHIYKDGYYQQGMPIGYYAGGDARVSGISVSYDTQHGNYFNSRLWQADVNPNNQRENKLYSEQGRLQGLEIEWVHGMSSSVNTSLKGWLTQNKMRGGHSKVGISVKFKYEF